MAARSRCVAAMNPHVDGDRLAAADGHDGALLQAAEQFGLHRERQLADFIEKKRAAIGTANESQRGRDGAGEAPLTWPKSCDSMSSVEKAVQSTGTNG